MKLLKGILFFLIPLLNSCGPNAEEIAKEKAKQDSITEVTIRKKIEDEQFASYKRIADSTRIADSIAVFSMLNMNRKEKIKELLPKLKKVLNFEKIQLVLDNDKLKDIEKNIMQLSIDEKLEQKGNQMIVIENTKEKIAEIERLIKEMENDKINDDELDKMYSEITNHS